MKECYCPECGVIKCPERLWGGECDCQEGLCGDCMHHLHKKHCKECPGEDCPVYEWLEGWW